MFVVKKDRALVSTMSHRHVYVLFFFWTAHVFMIWRASRMRASDELINNNLDKLSVSEQAALIITLLKK